MAAARKWPLIVLLFLLGSAAGWLLGRAIPAQYEASAKIKVSFNSDTIYLTPDDFKNWQLAELEDLALSEETLAIVLTDLQAGGGDWSGWTVPELRSALDARWRNAGAWQLTAILGDAARASQLAEAWRFAVLDVSAEALAHAAEFKLLDRRLDALAREIVLVRADIVLAESGEDQANFEAIEDELSAQYAALGREWQEEKAASLGLSAYLSVEMHDDPLVSVERQVSSAELALVGGFLTVLAWLALQLARADMPVKRDG